MATTEFGSGWLRKLAIASFKSSLSTMKYVIRKPKDDDHETKGPSTVRSARWPWAWLCKTRQHFHDQERSCIGLLSPLATSTPRTVHALLSVLILIPITMTMLLGVVTIGKNMSVVALFPVASNLKPSLQWRQEPVPASSFQELQEQRLGHPIEQHKICLSSDETCVSWTKSDIDIHGHDQWIKATKRSDTLAMPAAGGATVNIKHAKDQDDLSFNCSKACGKTSSGEEQWASDVGVQEGASLNRVGADIHAAGIDFESATKSDNINKSAFIQVGKLAAVNSRSEARESSEIVSTDKGEHRSIFDRVDDREAAGAGVDGGWVQFPYYSNGDETKELMREIRQNGTLPCHNVRTKTARIEGLPDAHLGRQRGGKNGSDPIQLWAGKIYELLIVSVGDDGNARCAGGDYYETDLSGPRWKSRPPILDLKNGTYSVQLQVDPRFKGHYTFKVVLLFANFHALHYHPQKYGRMEEVATFQLHFVAPLEQSMSPASAEVESDYELNMGRLESYRGTMSSLRTSADPSSRMRRAGAFGLASPRPENVQRAQLPICRRGDFDKKYWSGRWTRENSTDDCEYSKYGRWQCVDENLQCQKPWCTGPVGRLESNGWVYSAHCSFKIFAKEEAWKCLDGKWLFFWGDSNHIDSIRNLLNFILGFDFKIRFLNRRMDVTYFSPPYNRSSVRITSMFNGHSNVTMNYEGLFSLHDPHFANELRSFFTGDIAPDFMIMNSGLHDGFYWKDVERFLENGVEYAAEFWNDVWSNMRAKRPDLLYRTTVATGGHSRIMPFNPHKMELFNHLIVDRFVKLGLERFQIIDGFDYTFPWHWDHKTNDGVHYGRPPSKSKWAGGNVGHRYFVDLMLVHMLLNAICNRP